MLFSLKTSGCLSMISTSFNFRFLFMIIKPCLMMNIDIKFTPKLSMFFSEFSKDVTALIK